MDLKSAAWWIWLVTWECLAYGLFADQSGFLFAITATILNIFYYACLDKSVTSFSVQVRVGILTIFLLGQAPGMSWIYWIPFAGIAARNLTGYCLLARLMSLLPWNRQEPLTFRLIKRRIFSPPVNGSILTK